MATPRSTRSTCSSRCSTRSSRARSSSAPEPRRGRACPGRGGALGEAVDPGRRRPAASSLDGLLRGARPRRGGDAKARGRLRLHRAPPARAGRRPARRARRRAKGRARLAARHLPGSRGLLPGPGEVRPRPDRAGRAGQARPGDRARRRDPPRHPGALTAHEEQPGPDRRARRRQDRDRRGPRAAHRRRRRPGGPEGQARVGARHRRAARRLEVPRRVRGAAEGRAQRDQGLPRARSSSSSTSCTRSSAPARPRARSTPRTC